MSDGPTTEAEEHKRRETAGDVTEEVTDLRGAVIASSTPVTFLGVPDTSTVPTNKEPPPASSTKGLSRGPSRRTSTRVLSLNFQQSVRDLKKQEHHTRVKVGKAFFHRFSLNSRKFELKILF